MVDRTFPNYCPTDEEFSLWLRMNRKILSMTELEMTKLLGINLVELKRFERGTSVDKNQRIVFIGLIGLELMEAAENE